MQIGKLLDSRLLLSITPEMKQLFPDGGAPQYLYATYKSTAKINYLMFPILAKYHYTQWHHWDLYIAAGPFVSTVLYAKNITSGSSDIYLDPQQTQSLPVGAQSFDHKEDIKSDLHKFNSGVTACGGIQYKIGTNVLFFEVGGNYGFITIQKDDSNGKNNTGAAVFSFGYAFQIDSGVSKNK